MTFRGTSSGLVVPAATPYDVPADAAGQLTGTSRCQDSVTYRVSQPIEV